MGGFWITKRWVPALTFTLPRSASLPWVSPKTRICFFKKISEWSQNPVVNLCIAFQVSKLEPHYHLSEPPGGGVMEKEWAKPSWPQVFEARICHFSNISIRKTHRAVGQSSWNQNAWMSLAEIRLRVPTLLGAVTGAASPREPGPESGTCHPHLFLS